MKRILQSLIPAMAAIFLFLAPNTAWSQAKPAFAPNEMESILYGAAYYTEYMPYERLEQDAQLMQQAGLTVVRMGESSWEIGRAHV